MVALTQTARRSVSIADARGGEQSVRVTFHPDRSVVVVSHWNGGVCLASSSIALADLPALVAVLEAARRNARPAWPAPDPTTRRDAGPLAPTA